MPQCLEFFLDNNMHIISKSPEFLAPTTSTTSLTNTDPWVQGYQPPPPPPQQQQSTTPRTKPTPAPMPFVKNDDMLINNSSYTDQSYQQSLNDPQFVSRLDPSLYSPVIMPDFITQSLPSPQAPPQQHQQLHVTPSPNTNDILALLGLSTKSNTGSNYWPSDLHSTTPAPPPAPSSSSTQVTDLSKQVFPPMPAIDAINYLRRMNRGKPFDDSVFTPSK